MCRREESREALNAGNTFIMTPNGYITTEMFCKFLHHCIHQLLPGRALTIPDRHRTRLYPSVLTEARSYTSSYSVFLLTAAMSSSHWTIFFLHPSTYYWNEVLDNHRRANPGRAIR
jgi:hypothetical protein